MSGSPLQDLILKSLSKHDLRSLTCCESEMRTDNSCILRKLIAQGDLVYIEKGRLVIKPASGKPVPDLWFVEYEPELISSILLITGSKAYFYQDYSTGNFGEGRYSGVSIRFVDSNTSEIVYCCYGAELKKSRNSKSGDKGKPLRKGRFYPPATGKFVKTWRRLGMEMPRRPSEFHEIMGRLKGGLFSLTVVSGAKVDKDRVFALDVPFELVRAGIFGRASTGNQSANVRQPVGNSSAKSFGNETVGGEARHSLEPISTTCDKYPEGSQQEASYQEDEVSFSLNRPEDQTCEEWINDFDSDRSIH